METITTYGLLMVMQFATLEQCEDWADKLYGIGKTGCFESYEYVEWTLEELPPPRPEFFYKGKPS